MKTCIATLLITSTVILFSGCSARIPEPVGYPYSQQQKSETCPFNEAFRDLLITRLYDLRVPTTVEPNTNTLEITFKVQLIRHKSRRKRTLLSGVITAITGAVAVLRNAPISLVMVSSGVATDIANSTFDFHNHCEVLISTTIAKRGMYIFRSSNIYYINDPDFWHYLESFPEAEPLNFASGTAEKRSSKTQSRLLCLFRRQ